MRHSVLAGAAVFGVVLSAHADHRPTIYDGLLAGGGAGELSTFVDLMNQTFSQEDLQRIFGGEAVFTIFAPSNAAFEALFAALDEEELAALQDQNSGRLERLLRYHITQGAWHRPTGALRMLDDSVAHTYGEGGEFRIDAATVEDRVRYQNGVVAKIDKVIASPAAPLPGEPSLTASAPVNNLIFERPKGIAGSMGAHTITNGETWKDAYFVEPDKLVIQAGRKKSTSVASWFLDQTGYNNGTGVILESCTSASNTKPSGLNFAQVVSELRVTWWDESVFVCPNVVFAQGSDGDANNWWMGQVGATLSERNAGGTGTMVMNCTVSTGFPTKLEFESDCDTEYEFSVAPQ